MQSRWDCRVRSARSAWPRSASARRAGARRRRRGLRDPQLAVLPGAHLLVPEVARDRGPRDPEAECHVGDRLVALAGLLELEVVVLVERPARRRPALLGVVPQRGGLLAARTKKRDAEAEARGGDAGRAPLGDRELVRADVVEPSPGVTGTIGPSTFCSPSSGFLFLLNGSSSSCLRMSASVWCDSPSSVRSDRTAPARRPRRDQVRAGRLARRG